MPRESKAQKHILTAYNRDNQMLMRRKKARAPADADAGYAANLAHDLAISPRLSTRTSWCCSSCRRRR